MAYYIDIFSPETQEAFINSGQNVSGFRQRQENAARSIKPGDKLICYMTRLSRWFGVLEITDKYFIDDSPIFYTKDDPFIVRFKIKPIVLLPMVNSIPIAEDFMWKNLSFTKELPKGSGKWTGIVRCSLRRLSDEDGKYLEKILLDQNGKRHIYNLTDADQKELIKVTAGGKKVPVSIPGDTQEEQEEPGEKQQKTIKESVQMQSLLANIGQRMHFKIWVPRSDRSRVLEYSKPLENFLESLPLNYDDATLRTIENIDVLWIKGRSIVRAFEVEHTTSIYSGILRMADLMALQPNLNIKAHIVAPVERKKDVLREIRRPVFTYLERGPLSETCTFIPYDSIIDLSKEKRLEHMGETVLDEITEED